MRAFTYLLVATISLTFTTTVTAFGQAVHFSDTTKLDKRLSILNGKAFFNFPSTAVNTPRVADIMAADPNANRETRIFVDIGKLKLVMFAQELFALSNENIFADVSKNDPLTSDFKRRILTNSDSLITILTTPTLFDSTGGGILINSLLVKTQDNTVFKFDAYINPDGLHQKDEFVKLTEKIFASVAKGNRIVNLLPRQESYKLFEGDTKLVLDLPKNYFVTTDEKYDFVVYKLNKYKDITDTSYTSLTIYTGSHPSYFHKEYELDEKNASHVKGTVFQKPVDWLFFKENKNTFFLKEQIVPVDEVEKGSVIHVAMLSNREDLINELTKVVENIKLSK